MASGSAKVSRERFVKNLPPKSASKLDLDLHDSDTPSSFSPFKPPPYLPIPIIEHKETLDVQYDRSRYTPRCQNRRTISHRRRAALRTHLLLLLHRHRKAILFLFSLSTLITTVYILFLRPIQPTGLWLQPDGEMLRGVPDISFLEKWPAGVNQTIGTNSTASGAKVKVRYFALGVGKLFDQRHAQESEEHPIADAKEDTEEQRVDGSLGAGLFRTWEKVLLDDDDDALLAPTTSFPWWYIWAGIATVVGILMLRWLLEIVKSEVTEWKERYREAGEKIEREEEMRGL